MNTRLLMSGRKWVVDPQTGCWNWCGYIDLKGYGIYGRMKAHRAVWEITNGEKIPAGHDLHHKCRNTRCVNPDHCEPRQRGPHQAEHLREFTVAQLEEMRQMASDPHIRVADIAAHFGVPRTTIMNIVNGKRYREYDMLTRPVRHCELCGVQVVGRRRHARFCCVEHQKIWSNRDRLDRLKAERRARREQSP